MKNYVLKMFAVAATIFAVSCEDAEPELYNAEVDGSIATFSSPTLAKTSWTKGDFFVQDVPNPEFTISVGVASKSNVDRAITLEVDAANTTATASQYTIDAASLVIPANSYSATIKIKSNYANVTTAGSKLTLKMTAVAGAKVSFDNVYTLNIYKFCGLVRSEMLGVYDVKEFDASGAQIDAYTSVVTAGTGAKDIVMSNIYNATPSSQTKMTLNDANPAAFKLDFPAFINNLLANFGGTTGNAYVEAMGTGNTFSACAKTITFTYRLRFGANQGSATANYTVVATKR